METGVLSDVFLPLAIVVIMIAMGMTLTKDDFTRVLGQRKAVLVGMTCQLLVLPAIGFAVASLFGLATVFAVSMILLAASPGGSTSNLIVHISDGDRALSLALTALSNIVVFVSLPLYLGIAQNVFGTIDGDGGVPVGDLVVQIAALTVFPIALGMFIRSRNPGFADRSEEPGKLLSSAVFGVIVLGLVIQNWGEIVDKTPEFGAAFVTMNVVALAAGFVIANLGGLSHEESTTVGIETGIQNSALTVTIALTIFDSTELAIVPGLYGLWMLFTGFAFAFGMRRRGAALVAR